MLDAVLWEKLWETVMFDWEDRQEIGDDVEGVQRG